MIAYVADGLNDENEGDSAMLKGQLGRPSPSSCPEQQRHAAAIR